MQLLQPSEKCTDNGQTKLYIAVQCKYGGVDKCDQLIEPYNATRKSMIWCKKLNIHLIQLALLNAYVIYKSADSSRRMSFLDFTKSVITSLLFENQQTQSLTADSPNEDMIRLSERHFPEKIAPVGPKANPQKRCKVCHSKKVRHESRYICGSCPSKPGLCVDECFKIYHSKREYWK